MAESVPDVSSNDSFDQLKPGKRVRCLKWMPQNAKGRPFGRPLSLLLTALLLAANKLRVGFHAALGNIHALVLFLFADT